MIAKMSANIDNLNGTLQQMRNALSKGYDMHDAKLAKVFDAIVLKTSSKSLAWQETDSDEVFETVLEQFTIRIGQDDGDFDIVLLNSEGKSIAAINWHTLVA